jgi:serine/threonine protein kinase
VLSRPHHQLSGIAEGLNHLHYYNVIHGDLKGVSDCSSSRFATVLIPSQSNVLVDAVGHARITDFGLAMVTQNLDSIRNASGEYEHSGRWIAPEILEGRGTYSKQGDVFSFAMVTIEVRFR